MMEAESLDTVFIDLESDVLLRSKIAERKARPDQRQRSESATSSTSESSLRTRAVRLLSSMSNEVCYICDFYELRMKISMNEF